MRVGGYTQLEPVAMEVLPVSCSPVPQRGAATAEPTFGDPRASTNDRYPGMAAQLSAPWAEGAEAGAPHRFSCILAPQRNSISLKSRVLETHLASLSFHESCEISGLRMSRDDIPP